MENSKACTKCGQIKPLENYSRHNGVKSSQSGYRAQCKACQISANQIYRQENKQKVNAAKRLYNSQNKESKAKSDEKYRLANLDKIAKKNRQWRADNYDHTRQKARKWRIENKERKKATDKAWQQRNRVNVRNISLRRRARLTSNGIFRVSEKEILQLLSRACFYCGKMADHIDHIIPVSRGGRHSIGNLTGACAPCNLSKGSKFLMEWRKGRK
jgi:5-methylcytosine-specific restriction endonuclease McrA